MGFERQSRDNHSPTKLTDWDGQGVLKNGKRKGI